METPIKRWPPRDPHPDDPVEPYMMPPWPGAEVYSDYREIDISRLQERIRFFPVVIGQRDGKQTDEQWKAYVAGLEEYYWTLSVYRFLAHLSATELGYPAHCKQPACRRAGRCVTDRNDYDWGFPGPWMPPCAATYRMVDEVRSHIRAALDAEWS